MDNPGSTAENPYVGPVPFTTGQTLYGREADVQVLVDLVVAKRIVLLISPSGAGKTSLIQAALIPQIEKRFNVMPVVRMDATRRDCSQHVNPYVFVTLQALEKRLDPAARKTNSVLENMSLADYFRALPTLLDARGRTRFPLVIFDQFEELFTLNRSDWQLKKEFIHQLGELLGGTLDEPDEAPNESRSEPLENRPNAEGSEAPGPVKLAPVPPVWAVFSMREDHVAELEPYLHRIPTGLAFRQRLLPLEIDQAMQAINGPAPQDFPKEAAMALVDDLRRVKQVGSDANPETGFMGRFVEPLLLQVGCRRLWDQVVAGQGRPITAADIGSNQTSSQVDAALADYVSEEISTAGKLVKGTSRFLRDFLEDRLLSRNGVRTKVLRDPAQLGELEPALNQLIERHILRTDIAGDREWIELSHDRLIAPLYQGNQRWREEHLSLMQKQAKLWEEAGRPEDMLFTDVQLEHGEAFAKEHPEFVGELDLKFLAESRQKRAQQLVEVARNQVIAQKNQQLKMQLGFLLVSSVVLVGVAIWLNLAIKQANRAQSEAVQAQEKSYRDVLDARLKESALLVRDDNAVAGLKLLVSTQENIDQKKLEGLDAAVDTTLIRVLGRFPPIERRLGEHLAGVRSVIFAQGGELVLSGSMDKKLGFWPTSGNRTLGQSPGGHAAGITGVAYSESSGIAASADDGGDIVLWSVQTDTLRKISDVRWRIAPPPGPTSPGDPAEAASPQITSIALNSKGTILAAASRQMHITLWDITDVQLPKEIATFGNLVHKSDIVRIVFVPNGPDRDKLVSADLGGRVALWNPDVPGSGKPDATFKTQERLETRALAVSPDGKWIVAGDDKGDLHVWTAGARGLDQANVKILSKQSRGQINDLAFSRDGKSLFSVSDDKSLIRWTLPTNPVSAAAFEGVNTRATRIPGWDEKLYTVNAHPTRDGVIVLGGAKKVVLVDTEQRSPLVRPIVVAGVTASSWLGLRGSSKLDVLLGLEPDRKTVRLLRESGGQFVLAGTSTVESEDIKAIAMSREGTDFAVQGCSGRVKFSRLGQIANQPWMPEGASAGAANTCAIQNTLVYSPDGKTLIAVHGSEITIWRKAPNGEWLGPGNSNVGQEIVSIAIDPKGEQLVFGTVSNAVEVRRLVGDKVEDASVATSRGRLATAVIALSFSADGKRIIASTENSDVSSWEFQLETTRTSFSEQHDRQVDQLAAGQRGSIQTQFSGDRTGQVVACFGLLISSNCTRLGRSFGRPISGLAMSEDASRLVIALDNAQERHRLGAGINDQGARPITSGAGLYRWDLGRAEMLATASRLANDGRQ
jgi:WD40 repeat protein